MAFNKPYGAEQTTRENYRKFETEKITEVTKF